MTEEIKEKIKRFKKVFVEECGCYPTCENIRETIKMYTEGPTGCQAEIKRQIKQLEYRLSNSSFAYRAWDSDIVPIFESLKALIRFDVESRKKWWGE